MKLTKDIITQVENILNTDNNIYNEIVRANKSDVLFNFLEWEEDYQNKRIMDFEQVDEIAGMLGCRGAEEFYNTAFGFMNRPFNADTDYFIINGNNNLVSIDEDLLGEYFKHIIIPSNFCKWIMETYSQDAICLPVEDFTEFIITTHNNKKD